MKAQQIKFFQPVLVHHVLHLIILVAFPWPSSSLDLRRNKTNTSTRCGLTGVVYIRNKNTKTHCRWVLQVTRSNVVFSATDCKTFGACMSCVIWARHVVMYYLLLNEFHLVCWLFTITLWFMSLGMSPRTIYLLCNPSGNLRIGWPEECVVSKDLLLALQEDVTFCTASVSWNIPVSVTLKKWQLPDCISVSLILLPWMHPAWSHVHTISVSAL